MFMGGHEWSMGRPCRTAAGFVIKTRIAHRSREDQHHFDHTVRVQVVIVKPRLAMLAEVNFIPTK